MTEGDWDGLSRIAWQCMHREVCVCVGGGSMQLWCVILQQCVRGVGGAHSSVSPSSRACCPGWWCVRLGVTLQQSMECARGGACSSGVSNSSSAWESGVPAALCHSPAVSACSLGGGGGGYMQLCVTFQQCMQCVLQGACSRVCGGVCVCAALWCPTPAVNTIPCQTPAVHAAGSCQRL